MKNGRMLWWGALAGGPAGVLLNSSEPWNYLAIVWAFVIWAWAGDIGAMKWRAK